MQRSFQALPTMPRPVVVTSIVKEVVPSLEPRKRIWPSPCSRIHHDFGLLKCCRISQFCGLTWSEEYSIVNGSLLVLEISQSLLSGTLHPPVPLDIDVEPN